MNLTDEQERVVDAVFSRPGSVIVNAFAGTGKTTTCFAVIKKARELGLKPLYLVFNKLASDEAKKKAESLKIDGVDIKTVHSFAFSELKKAGFKFNYNNFSTLRVKDVADALYIDYTKAYWLLEFFNSFLLSHYSFKDISNFIQSKSAAGRWSSGLSYFDGISDLEKSMNTLINLILNGRLPMPHDFYLKYYVFSPYQPPYYDVVILDESQDANPLFIQLLSKIKSKYKLLVGDTHQRIYQFRNTVNAFHYFQNSTVLYLTKTFRFGNNISDLANTILEFKGEPNRIKPTETPKTVDKNYAVISYTNTSILEYYLSKEKNDNIVFEKDIDEVIKIVSTIVMIKENKIHENIPYDRNLLRAFANYKDLSNYIDKIKSLQNQKNNNDDESSIIDNELLQAYNIVNHFGFTVNDIKKIISDYKNRKKKIKKSKDEVVYLATAHASKGLEYNKVILLKDLAVDKDRLEFYIQNRIESITANINLLYVAITRATLEISLPAEIIETLEKMRELSDDAYNKQKATDEINFDIFLSKQETEKRETKTGTGTEITDDDYLEMFKSYQKKLHEKIEKLVAEIDIKEKSKEMILNLDFETLTLHTVKDYMYLRAFYTQDGKKKNMIIASVDDDIKVKELILAYKQSKRVNELICLLTEAINLKTKK